MSVIADLPDLRPSLLLDFANSRRVHPLIQCTRASTATCYGPDGKLRTVAANVPRIDYDPATGRCLGLLVEEARTNHILNSGDLSQSAWLKSRATAAAPDTDGFCKVVEDGANNSHYVSQTVTLTASDRVVRLLVKGGERTRAQIEFTGNTGNAGRRVVVDLVAGAVLSNTLIGSGGLAASSVSARLIGAGVTELTIQVTPTATTGATANLLIILHDGTGVSYQGDGVSGIYVKEVQLEAATFSTSYIPTTTAAVTRAADVLSVALENSADVTVVTAWEEAGAKQGFLWQMDAAGSGSERLRVAYSPTSNLQAIVTTANTPSTINLAGAADISAGMNAVAVAFGNATVAWARNGIGGAAANSRGALPATTVLRLGSSQSGTGQSNFRLRRLAIYTRALTQAQLQRLTLP